jgi:succinyl-diaminopimelate desuccinylase
MGSIHAQIKVRGKAAHSARPWEGINALYEAIPVLSYFAGISPVNHDVFGVTFKDVISITESASQTGRTSVPSSWHANVNFRYAPIHQNPESLLRAHCRNAGIDDNNITISDHAIAGDVIESPLFNAVIKSLSLPISAKQAWTDVAQLTQLGVPAFNFGPGLTAQAHQDNEYILLSYMNTYISILTRLLTTPVVSQSHN